MTKYNKGILLAGGQGTRLKPITSLTNKHLIPIYNKPMIYYSLSMLMLAKIRNICIVTDFATKKRLEVFLEDGSWLGMKITFKVQKKSDGIVAALNLCKDYIKNQNFALVLGDNFIFGSDLINYFNDIQVNKYSTNIFSYEVPNPEDFGIINNKTNKLIEKPKKYIGNKAIIGLYFLPMNTLAKSKKIKKSARGEKEITDLLNDVFRDNDYKIHEIRRGMKWMDMGTVDTIIEASQFMQTLEKSSYRKIACLEEISKNNKWIKKIDKRKSIARNGNSKYQEYLKNI